jgi:hypothetical protein
LIDELEVVLGNTVVQKTQHWQQLFWMLSTYAMDGDWQVSGASYRRIWLNRRVETANVINWPFILDTFPGFLSSGAIIDTEKLGRLTIRIRLADNATVSSSVAQNTWGFNNCYFRCTYKPDSWTDTDDRITYEDWVGSRMYFPGYNSRHQLVVDGRRKLNYAIGRCINTSVHDQKATGFDAAVSLTQRFIHPPGNIQGWEYTLNNQKMHAYSPTIEDGILSMREVFPDGVVNLNIVNSIPENVVQRPWACGVVLDLLQRPDELQNEIAFETTATSAGAGNAMYSFMYVSTTNTVEPDGKGGCRLIL